jgi:hypothetical protein
MMKVNVNTTPTLTIIVETFRSDKKYFGQTKPISLSDRMTYRSSDNLEQTGIKNTKFEILWFEIWCPDLLKKTQKNI